MSSPGPPGFPPLEIWHAAGRFTRLEGEACKRVRCGARRELAAATFASLTSRGLEASTKV
jgi:hypothetical protein